MIIVPVLVAAALPVSTPLPQAPDLERVVRVRDGRLMLGDVMDSASLSPALSKAARGLVLFKFSRSKMPQRLTVDAIHSRARALMPSLALEMPALARGHVRLLWEESEFGSPPSQPCLKAVRQVGSGEPAIASHFEPIACPSQPIGVAFRYDRSRQAVVAARSLEEGELVRSFVGSDGQSVAAGEKLTFKVSIGAFTVERPVEAMQGGRVGQSLFVKTEEGVILPMRLEGRSQ